MTFWIRNATNKDVVAVTELVKEVYDEYGFAWDPAGYHADLYDLELHYWRAGHGFWVAETIEDNRIIGTVGAHFFEMLPPGDPPLAEHAGVLRVAGCDCALERLYVDPACRGAGVGTTLIEHVIAIAQSAGKRRMEIWSDKKLENAHRLYEKLGATIVGERLCNDPDQSPEWGLVLPLRAAITID